VAHFGAPLFCADEHRVISVASPNDAQNDATELTIRLIRSPVKSCEQLRSLVGNSANVTCNLLENKSATPDVAESFILLKEFAAGYYELLV